MDQGRGKEYDTILHFQNACDYHIQREKVAFSSTNISVNVFLSYILFTYVFVTVCTCWNTIAKQASYLLFTLIFLPQIKKNNLHRIIWNLRF